MLKTLALALATTLLPLLSAAALRAETVQYRDGDVALEGYLAYDDAVKVARPGILVVHDWMGISDETRRRCDMLVAEGYVAFAADIYGKGVRPTGAQEAGGLAGQYKKDRDLFRRRLAAGLEVLRKQGRVDPRRLAAIGFCFGGTGVLELARSGADVRGVVSFHGGLDSPRADEGKAIRCKVLALHGADDPFVPTADLAAFQEEMRKGGVDWQMVSYGGAVHAFTNPGAGSDSAKGAAYNAAADRRSWAAMKSFLAELFATR